MSRYLRLKHSSFVALPYRREGAAVIVDTGKIGINLDESKFDGVFWYDSTGLNFDLNTAIGANPEKIAEQINKAVAQIESGEAELVTEYDD